VADSLDNQKNKSAEDIKNDDDPKSDIALLICFDNWLRIDKSFKLKFTEDEFKYTYRNISKDAMRC